MRTFGQHLPVLCYGICPAKLTHSLSLSSSSIPSSFDAADNTIAALAMPGIEHTILAGLSVIAGIDADAVEIGFESPHDLAGA